MQSETCPLCNKSGINLLRHLRFSHKINGMEQFNLELSICEKRKVRQSAFAKYTEELREKERRGEITVEKYRELITEWYKKETRV